MTSERHGPRQRLRGAHWLLLAMLVAHAVLAVTSLVGKSVTVDEFGHLPAGVYLLETGDFTHASLNPPLMHWLSALPVRFVEPSGRPNPVAPAARELYRSTANPFWRDGYRYMLERGADYQRSFVAARTASVAVVSLLAIALYAWARELSATRPDFAGLLAAGLVLFSPNMIAHGRLVTTDAGAAAAMTIALYMAWRFLHRPGPSRAACLGLALGAAQLVKFTALLLLPVIALLIAVSWARADSALRSRILAGSGLAFAIALAVLHLGYGFTRPFPPLGGFEFESSRLQMVSSLLPAATLVPLPRDYVSALDRQSRAIEQGDPSYLLGRSYHGGRWDYFLVLLATKTPLPILLLAAWVAARVVRTRGRGSGDALLFLLGPAAALLAVSSFGSEKQIGLRMVLPALPLGWCFIAVVLASAPPQRLRDRAAGLAVAAVALVSLAIHPDYLSYYNALAGGPSRGDRVAVQSNYDWGQDLIQLREQVELHGGGPIQLLYFGRVDPAIYGIDYSVPAGARVRPGLLAISATLQGRGYSLYDHGRLVHFRRPLEVEAARLGEPIATAGHSIRLYRVPRSEQPVGAEP
ncbi:MAG: phospholipid carrier-dependent glycosyltransferase [Myxococcota bacterium]|nr:phospholipid carrier-dependent glycosyltransferase [Myxococcota bacterium]